MAVQSPRKPQFANVRSSESGTVTLTSSDYRWQIFNASAALTVNLPGGGIAGDVWIIENRGSGALTLKSSDASTIATLNQNDVYGTASVQAAPTSSAHWRKAAGFGLADSTSSGLVNTTSQTFSGRKSAGNSKVKVYRSSAQSISNASATVIQFNASTFDTNSEFDTSSTYKFTAGRTGYYQFNGIVGFSGSLTAGNIVQVSLRKNGTTSISYVLYRVGDTGVDQTFAINDIVSLSSTDTVDVLVYQNSGGAVNIYGDSNYTRLSIVELL